MFFRRNCAHHCGLLTVTTLHLEHFRVYALQTSFITDSANRDWQMTIGANKQQRVREPGGHDELREASEYVIVAFRQASVRARVPDCMYRPCP